MNFTAASFTTNADDRWKIPENPALQIAARVFP